MTFFNIYSRVGRRGLAMPTKRLSLPSIPSAYQTRAPSSGLSDINYYLTEGLEGIKHQEYHDMPSFIKAIDSQDSRLCSGNPGDESASQYMVFTHVTQEELVNIDHFRDTHHKRLRFLYLNHPKALIVKIMPGMAHELAAREFGHAFRIKAHKMYLGRALADIGCATYRGISSRKEADGGFKPRSARPRATDWPTVVFECGVSQSAPRLKADGRWWLENSMGQVNMVLLFFVSKVARTIRIEHWEAEIVPKQKMVQTGHCPSAITPKIQDTIYLDKHSITRATLELDFQKIFLRAPVVAEGERNFTFTAQDLRDYYDDVWSATQ